MIIIKNRPKLLAVLLLVIIIPWLGITLANKYGTETTQPVNNIQVEADPLNNAFEELTVQTDEDFFAEYRMERERVRSRELEILREVVNDPAATLKAREAANLKMVEMAAKLEKEMQAEAMIKSQGFGDCAVVISTSSTTVMLGGTPTTVRQDNIKKAVSTITGAAEKSISVMKIQN